MLKENEQRFKDALKVDLGRPELESELYALLLRLQIVVPTTHDAQH